MYIKIGIHTFNNDKHLGCSDIAGKGWRGKKQEAVMGKPQAPSWHFCLQFQDSGRICFTQYDIVTVRFYYTFSMTLLVNK